MRPVPLVRPDCPVHRHAGLATPLPQRPLHARAASTHRCAGRVWLQKTTPDDRAAPRRLPGQALPPDVGPLRPPTTMSARTTLLT